MDRVKTGIEGLDQLLRGGFLRGDAVLLTGAPGSGKTNLGMQFIHNGITRYQEPGLFITFEEFPERIYRDAQSFGWDFRALQDEGKLKVVFTSPEVLQQDIVRDQGLMSEMIAETGARRVVVDSISHFQGIADNPHQFRESVYLLINALRRESLTALLTRELGAEEQVGSGPEEFVADGLIMLSRAYVGNHQMRYLEVMKSRGSPHIAIPSLFFITDQGIKVIPPFQKPFYVFEEAVSTGIAQLDDLLGGGIPYGGFYLMEVDSSLHQDVLDAGFAREALEAGDMYVRLAGHSDRRSRWRALMKAAGLDERLEQGIGSGQVVLLFPGGGAPGEAPLTREMVDAEVDQICAGKGDSPVRMQVDISRLMGMLPREGGLQTLLRIIARCRRARVVMLGVISPAAAAPDQVERVRAVADGIVRIWAEGSYSFLQVVKTVNSARTPVYAITQIPDPPFLEIVVQ